MFSFPSPFGGSAPASGYDRYTAVYDISARVVYLPDGTSSKPIRAWGTPSTIRATKRARSRPDAAPSLPVGAPRRLVPRRSGPAPQPDRGRRSLRPAGLLAHPFMLGPNGDSNGCVSFRDYEAFLKAYENGQINKLAVVTRL